MALSLSLINPTRGSVATSRSVCVVDGAAFAGSERQGTEVLGSTGGAVWMEASVPLERRKAQHTADALSLWDLQIRPHQSSQHQV